MITLIKGILLMLACITLTACSSDLGLRDDFDKSMKTYNRMIRWHEIENAGMTFIDKDLRDEFFKKAESFKKRGVSMADFRILTSECIPEKKNAEVIAEFDYYILPSNRVKTLTYRQEWVYQELIKSWKLKTTLPDFD